MRTRALLKSLYVQLLVGIAAGIILEFVAPDTGAGMRPVGDGSITLAATLSAFPSVPVVGLALLLGVDRFMSEGGRNRGSSKVDGTP